MQTISTATHFPSHIKSRIPTLLSTSLGVLDLLQNLFYHSHLSSEGAIEDADSSAEYYSTPYALAGKIIDFVGVALQNSFSKSTTSVDTLSKLVTLLQSYSRITKEEEEEWQANVSTFVAAGEEDELGALNSSMRARCADILSELILVKEIETLEALRLAVLKAHKEGNERQQRGEQDWWKEEEASLALTGGIAEHIVEKMEDAVDLGQSAPFDIESIFSQSVLPNIEKSSPFFLYGRCFVFASQFASILPEELARTFLSAAVGAIEEDAKSEGDAIVKISAIRCIKNFHRHLSPSLVQPFSSRILSRLGPLLTSANEEALVLLVETLQVVAMQESSEHEAKIPPEIYGHIVVESIRAWAREASDRILQSSIEDLLEAFAAHKAPSVALLVVQQSFTICAGLLNEEQQSRVESRYRSGVTAEGALEFTGAIARGASGKVLSQSDAVSNFLGPLFSSLNKSDDREVYKVSRWSSA